MSVQGMYAMYVIGQVESNHNWAAINPSDPITLGMMQWYGNRAKSLILRGKSSDPTGYNQYFAGTTAAAHANANADMSYYYTNQGDQQAWYAWAATDNNHAFQQAQWEDDYNTYQTVCDNQGFPAGNMRERVFFMTMYHQSPVSAFRVLGSCSATANLDLLHSMALNDYVLGQYPNRYNTAYTMLRNWDGTSAPPNFGQVGTQPSVGGNSGSSVITGTPASKQYIQAVGDILQYHDGNTITQFYASGQQTWVHRGTAGTPISGGQTNTGTDTSSTAGGKVVDWVKARINKFQYSQASGRLNPDSSGYTDCSGLPWRAYMDVTGVDVGTWTGAMAGKGTRIAVSGTDSAATAISRAKAGDLILFTWSGYNASYDHVEIFCQDNNPQLLSHGGPGAGPNYTNANTEISVASMWEVRRYV